MPKEHSGGGVGCMWLVVNGKERSVGVQQYGSVSFS